MFNRSNSLNDESKASTELNGARRGLDGDPGATPGRRLSGEERSWERSWYNDSSCRFVSCSSSLIDASPRRPPCPPSPPPLSNCAWRVLFKASIQMQGSRRHSLWCNVLVGNKNNEQQRQPKASLQEHSKKQTYSYASNRKTQHICAHLYRSARTPSSDGA